MRNRGLSGIDSWGYGAAHFDRPVLAGRHVRLEPLTLEHAEGLLAAGEDPGVWTWLAVRQPADLPEMRAYVGDLLARHEAELQATWTQIDVRDRESGLAGLPPTTTWSPRIAASTSAPPGSAPVGIGPA